MKKLFLAIILILNILLCTNKSFACESIDSELIKEILYYGTLAPSSHNAQMWKVKILSDNKIKILFNEARLLKEVDPNNREAFISLGAFIENISQASINYGYYTHVNILAKSNSTYEIAELEFVKTKKCGDINLLKVLQRRHTDRSLYLTKVIDKKALKALLEEFKDSLYYYPLNGKEGQYIKNSLVESNKKQANINEKQEELSNWMRLSWGDVLTKKDGITPKMMGIKFPIRLVVYTFFNKKSVMSDSFKQAGINKVKEQTENCAGYFVITNKSNTPEDLINSGRMLERFWLKAAEHEISIHPMSQSLEEYPWKDEISKKLKMNKPAQMLVRAGYVKKYSTPKSKRIPVDQLVEN